MSVIETAHKGQEKRLTFSNIAFSNAFSWNKIVVFGLELNWSIFRLSVVSGNDLARNRRQATSPTNVDIFCNNMAFRNHVALVKIMAWLRPGDKPLSEQVKFSLPTHICVTRPQLISCNNLYGHFASFKWSTSFQMGPETLFIVQLQYQLNNASLVYKVCICLQYYDNLTYKC